MDRQYRFNCFIFNNNQSVDPSVDSITYVNHLILIKQRQFDLSFRNPAAFTKFISMAVLISRFKQAGSQCLMNLNCTINNIFCNRLKVYHFFNLKNLSVLRVFAVKKLCGSVIANIHRINLSSFDHLLDQVGPVAIAEMAIVWHGEDQHICLFTGFDGANRI